MSCVQGASSMMVGTDVGSVYAVDVTTFKVVEEPFLEEMFV